MRAPRSAAFGAVASLLLLATLTGGPPRAEATPATVANLRPAAAVAWPPSTGLLLAEVVTGGASASDEYVASAVEANTPREFATRRCWPVPRSSRSLHAAFLVTVDPDDVT